MKIDLRNRQHLLLLLVGLLAVYWIGDKLVIGPLAAVWQARSERIVELRKRIQQGKELLVQERRTLEKWERMRTNALPGAVSSAEGTVLRSFDKWSADSRISVTSVRPQWKHPEEDYMTLECRVDASGSLAALSRFLYELEADPIGVRIDSLELSSRESDGSQLTLGLTVNGLYLNPPPQ
ncbi:MAG: hypothetical protein DVB31_05090 [Verrucomicrobia bacterium]|nr:MAG: hypothetical protein DVB31_05090 [Verrucomicrobiota bacterium]